MESVQRKDLDSRIHLGLPSGSAPAALPDGHADHARFPGMRVRHRDERRLATLVWLIS
jgi:hypothetical protein